MSASDHLLALDLGTTSVRALVIRADARVVAQASRPLTTRFPQPGWVEQEAGDFWDSSRSVLCEALAASRLHARDIAGLGVVSQRASTVAWDAVTSEPLAPVIGWQDGRTAARAAELHATGLPVPANGSALKFEWMCANEPRVAQAAESGRLRLGTPDAWLTWMLSGGDVHATDPGHASCTVLCDPHAREWAEGLCGLFSVPCEALPEIRASSAVLGTTPAALLGAPVEIASRAGDQQASAFAQAVHTEGQAKLTLGTSAMLDLHCGHEPAALADGIFPLALWTIGDAPLGTGTGTGDDNVAYCREGSVFTAGAAVDWLVSLGIAADAAEVEALASSVDDGGGAVCVPALQGLGSPFLDADAKGILLGLTRGTGRGELARAVLEGVAQRCTDIAELLALAGDSLRVDGGLARSDVLLQALADASGLQVLRSAELETTALGAAFLAGIATGVYTKPGECAGLVEVAESFEPESSADRRAAQRERWLSALARSRDDAPPA